MPKRRMLLGGWRSGSTPDSGNMRRFSGIPFPKIVGMRNRVVHDYGNVDFEIL
jgi:uncharacterized protein with HEPN domain